MKWALTDFEKISAAHGMREDEAYLYTLIARILSDSHHSSTILPFQQRFEKRARAHALALLCFKQKHTGPPSGATK